MSRSSDLEKDEQPGVVEVAPVPIVNASGHCDQLPRQYRLLDICATALVIDNAWVGLGGSVVVSIANGGPPGLLYEFLVACGFYTILGLCIAEMASAIPASGGVYHWASVTPGPRYGRFIGFCAGHLGFWGWLIGWTSISFIPANIIVQMYALYHPDYVQQPWHFYVTFLLVVWLSSAATVFGNRFMPFAQKVGLWIVCIGCPVSIIILVALPDRHASHSFVWSDFENVTGWPNGVAFLAGVLNGAYVIGTPDSITHIAEELPHPRKDLPKAIFAQLLLGSITSLCYAIALMYAITDLDAVVNSPGAFPLAAIYAQATRSQAGTFGLLFIVLISTAFCVTGNVISISRNLWALAREDAVPFAATLATVNERLGCPVAATVTNAVFATLFGTITLGSRVAFNDLAGSFIILTTTSFLLFILPNALTHGRYVPKGPFNMGPRLGPVIHWLAVVLILFFNVIFCLPFALPVTPGLMNYNCVILPGILIVTAGWWICGARRRYRRHAGPKPIKKEKMSVELLADAIKFCLTPEAQSAAEEMGAKIRASNGVDAGVRSFHQHLPLMNMRCDLCPEWLAVWWSAEHSLKLSACAAQILVDAGVLKLEDLVLHRPLEYASLPEHSSPLQGGGIIESFRRALDARTHLIHPVKAVSGLVMEPYKGAKREGFKGFLKGTVTGYANVTRHPITGIWGAISKTMNGDSAGKSNDGPSVDQQLRAVRTSQGAAESSPASPSERAAVVDRFRAACAKDRAKERRKSVDAMMHDARKLRHVRTHRTRQGLPDVQADVSPVLSPSSSFASTSGSPTPAGPPRSQSSTTASHYSHDGSPVGALNSISSPGLPSPDQAPLDLTPPDAPHSPGRGFRLFRPRGMDQRGRGGLVRGRLDSRLRGLDRRERTSE